MPFFARCISAFWLGLVAILGQAQTYPLKELSLTEAVQAALANDPQFRAAMASRDAGLEKESIALGGLLPTLSATITRYPNSSTETRIPNSPLPSQQAWTENTYDYDTRSVTLRQPVIRLRNWASYLQGRSQTEQANAQFRFDRYRAITRVMEVYSNWLLLDKTMISARAKTSFLSARVAQIKAMRQKGQAGLTDELQAQADHQKALFDQAEVERDFAYVNERFVHLVGIAARPKAIENALDGRTKISADSVNDLKTKVLAQNPELKTLQLAIENAKWDVKKFQSDHLPTLDFVANYAEENNATSVVLGRETKTTTMGLQLTIPIYQGGIVNASTRQAAAELRRLQAELNASEQRIVTDLVRIHASLKSAIQLYQFAQEQTRFARENLKSMQEQRRLGFKTGIDVSKAQELLTTSLADQGRAQSMWMISKTELLAISGELDDFMGNEVRLLFRD